jgi:alpha-glucosidase (family GH31 glycosyl hydrolase)
MRLHSTSNDLLGKEPWRYRKDVELFTEDQMRLRHRMLPYIYSMNYRTYKDARALCEPMYYNNPDSKEAYQVKNQYYF